MIAVGLAIAGMAAAPNANATAAPIPKVVAGHCQPCADLRAINDTIHSVYDVISGPPGQKRDFDRMRSLFAPGATMKAIGPRGLRGGTVEDYIARNSAILEREGFTERELGRRIQLSGALATAWSAYDGRTANGSFHERGINSFQLVKVDGKWLVASIVWQEETPENPLPADLTKGSKK
jgi:hypothetical protein